MAVPQIDASTYNRFLLTAGVALLALAILAPWLLLRESAQALLSEAARSELSETSASLLERREEFMLVGFHGVSFLSALLAVAGGWCIATGALRLRRRQAVLDRLEDQEVEERDLRIRQQRPDEQEEKRAVELAEVAGEEIAEPLTGDEPSAAPTASPIQRRATIASEHAAVEELVLTRLDDAFGAQRVDKRVAVAGPRGRFFIDAVVRAAQRTPDLVVEVKYQTVPSSASVGERAQRLAAAVDAYGRARNKDTRGVLLYVLPPTLEQWDRRKDFEHRLRHRAFAGWSEAEQGSVEIIVVGMDELAAMDSKTLRKRLLGSATAVEAVGPE